MIITKARKQKNNRSIDQIERKTEKKRNPLMAHDSIRDYRNQNKTMLRFFPALNHSFCYCC